MKILYINSLFLASILFIFLVIPEKAYTSGFRFKENCSVVEIPFKTIKGMIIIPVSINGSEDLNFVLDTGARSMILFNKKYAEKLKLNYDRTISFLGVGNSKVVDAFVSYKQDVSLPGVEAKNISIITMNNPMTILTGKGIQGAIGYQIFSQFIVKIDYENMIITLYKESSFKPDPLFNQLPLTVEDAKPYITSTICTNNNHLSVSLMIDTGFNDDLMLYNNENTKSWIGQTSSGNADIIGYGLGGSIKGSHLYNVEMHIENTTISGMDILTPKIVPMENSFKRLDGLIGNKLMNKFFVVVIDYGLGKFYFKNMNRRDASITKSNHKAAGNC